MQGWKEHLLSWLQLDIEHSLFLASCVRVLEDTSNCKDSGTGGFKEATFYFPIAKA